MFATKSKSLLTVLCAFVSCHGRILQQRDPKVDPQILEAVVSDVVEHSMNDLRAKLSTSLYRMLFPNQLAEANRKITEKEERLVATFINQLIDKGNPPFEHIRDAPASYPVGPSVSRPISTKIRSPAIRVSDSPLSPPFPLGPQQDSPVQSQQEEKIDPASKNGRHVQMRIALPEEERISDTNKLPSKLTVALETFTTKVPTKIRTIEELRLSDQYDVPQASSTQSPWVVRAVTRMPSWVAVLLFSAFIFCSIVLIASLLMLVRSRVSPISRRSSHTFPSQGFSLPDCDNGPGSFLERINELRRQSAESQSERSRDRDSEDIWKTANSVRRLP